jgi:hypothetical protein
VIITNTINAASRMIASFLPVCADNNRGLVEGFCIFANWNYSFIVSLFDKRMSRRNELDQQSQGQINVNEHVVRRLSLLLILALIGGNI